MLGLMMKMVQCQKTAHLKLRPVVAFFAGEDLAVAVVVVDDAVVACIGGWIVDFRHEVAGRLVAALVPSEDSRVC